VAQDIIDAEFETIRRDDDGHPVRKTPVEPAPGIDIADDDQIEILKSEAGKSEMPGRRAQMLYALSVLFSSVAAFLISGGHVLFQAGAAALDPPALEIAADPVRPLIGRNDVMTVSATVRNATGDAKRIPDVLLTFRSPDGQASLVYRVARGETLEPGKSLAFTVRMPKKPGYGQAPSLRFDNSGV
jgi:hypothetical protein